MSIEKFNPRIFGETVPYTQVNTRVIQSIDNIEAGFVWVYLLSLPPTWKVVKEHLYKKFKIGNNKLKKILTYLSDHHLIEYIRIRLENGQMGGMDIRVLNGSKFVLNPDQRPQVQILRPWELDAYISPPFHESNPAFNDVSTRGIENPPLDNHASGKPGTINKTSNKIIKKAIKEISCAPGGARPHPEDGFTDFMEVYPRKQGKDAARKAWIKHKCAEHITKIMVAVRKRKELDEQWQDLKFVPLPATFLNGKRWEDEIIVSKGKKQKESHLDRALRLAGIPKARVVDAETETKDIDKWGF